LASKDKARQYKPSHVKRLFTLSGNQCFAPDCTKPLIARDQRSIIAKICHIEAAADDGPRFNPDMTDDDRRHFDNLLLLCDECHTIIDNIENEADYPVKLLSNWKKQHESKLLYEVLNKQPALLSQVITKLANANLEDEAHTNESAESAFQIRNKLDYNSVKRNRPLIEDFKIFNGKLNTIYQALESDNAFKMESLFRNIKMIYVKSKGKYIQDFDNQLPDIKKHSDDIFEDVEERLLELAQDSDNTVIDDISFGVSVVMVDAFMRCKILEEPKS
jgi:hypothetical protein